MRTLLFPQSRLNLEQARASARELNEQVGELARRYEAELVYPDEQWYGFDPIHIRRAWKHVAWRTMFNPWRHSHDGDAQPSLSWRDRWVLFRLRPEQRWMFGVEQTKAQPSGRLNDGSTLSIY
jgi:hypothetical protein